MDLESLAHGAVSAPPFAPPRDLALRALPAGVRSLALAGTKWNLAELPVHAPALQHLALADHALTRDDVEALAALPALETLELTRPVADAQSLALPRALPTLSALRRLRIRAWAAMTDATLGALVVAAPGLTDLALDAQTGGLADALAVLAARRGLRSLVLARHESVVDAATLAAVAALPDLRSFALREPTALDAAALPLFARLTALDELAVSQTRALTDATLRPILAALPGLSSLAIDRTQVTGACLDLVAAMPRLRVLALGWGEVTARHLLKLAAGSTALEALEIDNIRPGAAVLEQLATLPRLRWLRAVFAPPSGWIATLAARGILERLELSSTSVTAKQLAPLAGCASLVELGLYQCPRLADAATAAVLGGVASLEVLRLGHQPSLGDKTFAALGALPRLAYLEAPYLKSVTDAGVRALAREGGSLRELNLQGTTASIDALDAVVRAVPLTRLILPGAAAVGGADVARWRAQRPALMVYVSPERSGVSRATFEHTHHDPSTPPGRVADDASRPAPDVERWPSFEVAADAGFVSENTAPAWDDHPPRFGRWIAGPDGDPRAFANDVLPGVCVAARGVVVRIRGGRIYHSQCALDADGRTLRLVFYVENECRAMRMPVDALVAFARGERADGTRPGAC